MQSHSCLEITLQGSPYISPAAAARLLSLTLKTDGRSDAEQVSWLQGRALDYAIPVLQHLILAVSLLQHVNALCMPWSPGLCCRAQPTMEMLQLWGCLHCADHMTFSSAMVPCMLTAFTQETSLHSPRCNILAVSMTLITSAPAPSLRVLPCQAACHASCRPSAATPAVLRICSRSSLWYSAMNTGGSAACHWLRPMRRYFRGSHGSQTQMVR